jgi:cysteine synthase B
MTRRVIDVGVFAGISAGAVAAAAVRCAGEIDEGVVVFIAADGGWKYLSTGAWTDDIDAVEARARTTIYF